jgi:hypothetical protein
MIKPQAPPGVVTAAKIMSHVLSCGAQAGAHAVACGDATLPQQEKNTRINMFVR